MKPASRRRERAPQPPDFRRYQLDFAAHVRDPAQAPRPAGVPARRMRVYNELVFNNVLGFVTACFPVTRTLLGVRRWKALTREFLARHRSRSPLFRQIPEEFVRFMEGRGPRAGEPDFLVFLLHHEWVELALDTSNQDKDTPSHDRNGDLIKGRPVLNPVHMLLRYPYAVHRIGPRCRHAPSQREDTWLLAFRNLDDRVRFIALNPASARLIALLASGRLSGARAVEQVTSEIRHPDPAAAREGGRRLLAELREEQAILGTRRTSRGR